MDWNRVYADLRKRNWTVLLLLSAASFFLWSDSFTMGVILGGFIIMANFRILQSTIRRAFSLEGVLTAGKFSVVIKYYLRLLAIGFVIYLVISNEWVDPIGLAIGLSTIVISIVSFGIGRAWRMHAGEAI